jgi:hypothetical protein
MAKADNTDATRKEPVDGSSAPKNRTLEEVFASIEEIRKRVKPLPKGMTIKDLIEEGRK